jgi:photosystem II stability/assembly factor-like uncharacterized protein
MRKFFISIGIVILFFIYDTCTYAQKYISTGEEIAGRNSNRLISVKSANGKQLYQPERTFFQRKIDADGKMNEPEWKEACVVTPFISTNGINDKTSVSVLYDKDNIYLFWSIQQPDGITTNMKEKDGLITSDDYVQVDLKPWLPDNIAQGRDYSFSIAVNPKGIIWDSYLDPYLGGIYFSSWNSSALATAYIESDRWQVEMIIPFSGLDVYSDPGWKWNLEFHHCTYNAGVADISSSNIGVTVQQNIMVREKGLVSYYWPRQNFMLEVKPDLSLQDEKYADVAQLKSVPGINNMEDSKLWVNSKIMAINHTDKMGELLTTDMANARIGISGNLLCFCLNAEGAGIQKGGGSSGKLGAGMDAQLDGVNGVFVDQSLFQNESFWIVLQPRNINADNIHQDYYLIVLNSRGEIKGTHYDKYGEPYREWVPKANVDIYNTKSGWGAELMLDMGSLDLSVDYSKTWGINIFRNRMSNGKKSELQVWKYTGNDFINPSNLGKISGISINNISVFRSSVERNIEHTKSMVLNYARENKSRVQEIQQEIGSIKIGTVDQLRESESKLQNINNTIGILQSSMYFKSVPHPDIKGGYPLMDVTFIGSKGWAVGSMGTILRTEDSGNSWQRVSLASDADLYRVKFVNENEGWAAGGRIRMAETNELMRHDKRGGFGYIFHTIDGGKTWTCQFAERGRHLFALEFVDKNIGYACGERGFLVKTIDGGRHWNILPTTGTLNWLYGMAFKDKVTGFAVGLNETVIKTTDGGISWTKVVAIADKKFYGFQPIYRDININGKTGCIVGQNGTILISSDGGETWEPTATFYSNEIRELMDLRNVRFVSPLKGYAVSELGNKIMTTEDGGHNWIFRSTGNSEWLRAIWAEPSGKLIVVGEREKVLSSSNDGLSWNILHGEDTKIDVMTMMAHGDDAPLEFNSFFAHYAINEGKKIVDVGVLKDVHSSEYEETYNIEHDRDIWMTGVGTSTNFCQFENGNNGSFYYPFNERLWEGEENVVRRMVAAIRAYKPDIIITHEGVYGDYDKPDHKLSGRAGLKAFESAGGEIDHWPELTRIGLKPWQPKKLYNLAGQSYPPTLDLTWIGEQPLKGTNMTCKEYGNYVIRNFNSQGVYVHSGDAKLCLVKSLVPVPEKEKSVFDGLDK